MGLLLLRGLYLYNVRQKQGLHTFDVNSIEPMVSMDYLKQMSRLSLRSDKVRLKCRIVSCINIGSL